MLLHNFSVWREGHWTEGRVPLNPCQDPGPFSSQLPAEPQHRLESQPGSQPGKRTNAAIATLGLAERTAQALPLRSQEGEELSTTNARSGISLGTCGRPGTKARVPYTFRVALSGRSISIITLQRRKTKLGQVK